MSRASAVVHINAFPEVTLAEHAKREKVYKAFQKVINSPEGAKALENPALKPLLDLAAD